MHRWSSFRRKRSTTTFIYACTFVMCSLINEWVNVCVQKLCCVALSGLATDRSWKQKTWKILTINPQPILLILFHRTPFQHLNRFLHHQLLSYHHQLHNHHHHTLWRLHTTMQHRYHSNRISSRSSCRLYCPLSITIHINNALFHLHVVRYMNNDN